MDPGTEFVVHALGALLGVLAVVGALVWSLGKERALMLCGVLVAAAWFLATAFSRWTGARAAELPGLVVVAPLVVVVGLVGAVIGTVAVRRDNRAPQDVLTGTELHVRPRARDRAPGATDGPA